MAGTIQQGNVSTADVLGGADPDAVGERVLDMDEKIRILDPDQTQFTTMTSKTESRVATREKVNWLEEELFPNIVTNVGAQTSGDVSLTLTAGQGKIVAGRDLLRNMRTGEGIFVTSVATDVLTVVRGQGSIAAAAINSGDSFLVIGDAQAQGSDFPVSRYLARVLGYNYTQITRTGWSFTGTHTAIELYGGREPAKEAKRKAIEHKRKWEDIGFFGIRSFVASAAPENEPRGTAGGLIEYITSIKRDSAGPIAVDFFDTFAMDVFGYGTSDKVLFAAPVVVAGMSKWNRSGMGAQWDPGGDRSVHGVKVDAFISGAYGYRIPVIVKKEWGKYPTANKGYGGYAFLVDMNYVERRPLRDRDTKLLTEQQQKGQDTYKAEYFTEASYEIACQNAHGIIFGCT